MPEQVVWEGRKSLKSYLLWIIIGIVTVFGWVLIFPLIFLKWIRTRYKITNRRIVRTDGILSKDQIELGIDKVTDTTYSQGIIGRFLGYADLVFNTAGSPEREMVFERVSDPEGVVKQVREL